MAVITGRKECLRIVEDLIEKNVSMAVFCTASHWNTEAILLAATKFCKKYEIESIPISVAMTFNYRYMPQAQRVTHCRNPQIGFLSIMQHLHLLCDSPDSIYRNITVLPHLDHADPEYDQWALMEGSRQLASVMFDAQRYPPEKNVSLTRDYVRNYGKNLLVEGILEQLNVADKHVKMDGASPDHYLERAEEYVKHTGIDFLVADLGTEQQSASSGGVHYLQERARQLTAILGRKMLVLHGTSSLDQNQMQGLAEDGVIRVNMWTKIAREAGKYAAGNLFRRAEALFSNDFEAAESNQYLMDSIEKASDLMLAILETLNYQKLARK